ncbi:hypothetical protein [Aquimarina litoralis]|uniref:hypothetical protein n=1 Tax=Aquimarina litoralis TaxID=584605 RepID=UPI001C56D9A8|nr:hypothetical protein [Aquimarina litoralis]MBW1298462.1 hypothetical protein [Aquimarina litoralis]
MKVNFLSNFGILGGFRHISVLIAIAAHNFMDPYIHIFLVEQDLDNEYSRIISNGLITLIIYLVIEFITNVSVANNDSLSTNPNRGFQDRLEEFKEFAIFFTISEIVLIGILCFIVYKNVNHPLLQSWGITGSIVISYAILHWYRSGKTKNAIQDYTVQREPKDKTDKVQYISFKEADRLYDIKQLMRHSNVDDIDREYEDNDKLILYKGDTTLQELHWEDKDSKHSSYDCIGIIVDGNLQITKGIKNTEHLEKLLYVTKDVKTSYVINFDTLIHIDGDLFISDYLYADSFFGYIQCLGQLSTPYLINNGQQINTQKIYGDIRIDISDFSPTHPLYTYGLKDVVKEVLNHIDYTKNDAEIDEEKLIEYLQNGKPILR